MANPLVRGEDFAFFSADDAAREAWAEESSAHGMQLAMLQPSAPLDLVAAASRCFQRSW